MRAVGRAVGLIQGGHPDQEQPQREPDAAPPADIGGALRSEVGHHPVGGDRVQQPVHSISRFHR